MTNPQNPPSPETVAARKWCEENGSRFEGQLTFGENLAKHTYYRIGGPARIFCIPKSVADLDWIRECVSHSKVDAFILGLGSNILVADGGYDGLVIKTSRIDISITLQGDRLRVGSGVAVSSLLRRAAQEGWSGFEMLTGVPGSIGGVITMNAGTHLGEARDRIRKVETFNLSTGVLRVIEGADLQFEYRKNHFLTRDEVITHTEWEVTLSEPAQVKAVIDETLARRKASQPTEYPSCGSVFKNPRDHGIHAWQVIEKLQLRGHRIGNAQISEKHPNFIVNLGGALASDVRALIDLVKSRAKAELGIEMHEEVKFLG